MKIDLENLSALTDENLIDALYAVVLELGWNIAIPTPDGKKPDPKRMVGMVIGTDEYIQDMLGISEEEVPSALLN